MNVENSALSNHETRKVNVRSSMHHTKSTYISFFLISTNIAEHGEALILIKNNNSSGEGGVYAKIFSLNMPKSAL